MNEGAIEDLCELSAIQQGILFHSVQGPGSGVYVVQMECILHGALDASAFERAWQRLVDAHAMLRTCFVWERVERPLQVVQRRVALALDRRDWTALPAAEQEARLSAYLEEDRRRGFDPARAPLMRVALFHVGEGVHRLVWTHHHILLDGWSVGMLLKAVLELYDAELRGAVAKAPVREASRPFSEYVVWQQAQDRSGAEAFWRERLRGFARRTRFGVDCAPPGPSRTGELRIRLSAAETARLSAAARAHRLTLATVTLGAWGLLLARYSGDEEVVFGTTVSTRPPEQPGFESIVGPCINTLPVRLTAPPSLGVSAWLSRLQEDLVAMRPHGHAALVDIQRWSGLPSGERLFDSIVAVENYPVDASLREGGAGLAVRDVRWRSSTSYPLAVMVLPGAETTLCLQHDESRFSADVAARMLDHYRELLRAIAGGMEGALEALPMLTGAERRRILVEWNDTSAALPTERGVHELIEAQARRTPSAVAAAFGGAELTYDELDRRANRVARHLGGRGVVPGALVGVCLDRSLELMVALLGVWKAGCAFVPLDPSHPDERLARLLADARVSWVLTRESLVPRLPSALSAVSRLDADWPVIAEESADPLASGVSPEDLAYVLYTSGSTGTPKGVMVPHRGLVNYLSWATREYAVSGGAGAPVHTSIAFDLTLTALFAPLVVGRKVELLAEARGTEALAAALRAAPAPFSLVKLTPSHVDLLGSTEVPGVRAFVVGGETLRAEHVAALRAAAPGAAIFNEYGPTEAVVGCSVYRVSDPDRGQEPIPIGRPIANTQLYVLDRSLSPVPVGAPGELCIGGAGLAHGYLRRPGLTAERFVPHPFSDAPGARLYRTGDRARLLPDGNIELLGRLDQQVKVRGFRIEPAEIEGALESHPAVREAAVVVRQDAAGAAELLACWVPRDPGQAPPAAELRRHLRRMLPEPMVPALFAELERFPQTANGKTDRAQLRAAPAPVPSAEAIFVAPRTEVEQGLAEIWAHVLGVPRVGAHDDFLDLGGHSLSALRVLSRVRARFQIDLPMARLFEARTLAELARAIELARRPRLAHAEAPIPRRPAGQGAPPASFAQQRLWLLDRLQPGRPVYNVPLAVRIDGALDAGLLERSLREVILRHEILRTTFAMSEGRLVQTIAPAASFALQRIPLTATSNDGRWAEARSRLAVEAARAFDLGKGPLLRASLLTIDEHEHALLVTMHHIVSDGWSRDVLVREIAAHYDAGLRGAPAGLPELAIQFADFAFWQRGRATGDAELAYWKQQLAGLTPLDLPADRQRPPAPSFRGAQRPFLLPAALRRAIDAFGREHGVTPFVTLLAAFVALLHRLTAATDMAIGSPVADRSRPETEGLMGPFLNTLVLRCRPSADLSFSDLVDQVGKVVRAAQAHQDVPFEQVVAALVEHRDESRNPLFQVLFDLQHAPVQPALVTGLRLVPLDVDSGTAKVDLALHLWEAPDGLRGAFEYSTDLFDDATITRMVVHFQRLLEGAASGGKRRISELPLLTERARREVLFGWNETRADYPEGACLHRLFEAQVERTPDAVAVVFEDAHVTYRELDRRANRLARHLQSLGAGPETLVGVHLERSVDLVAALLAILKAGGAYLPLEPSLPRDRLAFMIEDAGASMLLTRGAADDLPPHHACRLDLDDVAPALLREDDTTPRCTVTAQGLAYVIYTSGSTGRPKGVMIQHDGICNRLLWMQEAYRLTAADRVLQKTPLGFDVSVWELFWPLLAGARLVLTAPGRHGDAAHLVDLVAAQGITTLHFVPSLLRAVVDEPGFLACTSLERVICSGEALPLDLAERFSARSRAALHNLYGPTEASVDVTAWAFRRGAPRVLIGRPIANMRVHVLDPGREPAPIGVPGELYLGGVGLARGYLGRPALTAERFLPDPFSDVLGARLYRTGDRCRYLPGGDVEILGRLDDQVKIRGVRVEPGEIEAELGRHAAVGECIVIAREDEPGGARLFAYFVPRAGLAPGTDELRRHLGAALPDAMIPAAFLAMDALPRTASGKVDRRALPRPTGDRPSLGERYVAPETLEERELAAIWSQALGVDRVGVHDDFFALGGDSMRGIQIVALAQARGLSLSLRRLLREPTIHALARGEPDGDLPARPGAFELLRPDDRARVPPGVEDAYPLTALQLGMVFHDAYDPGAQLYRNVDSVHLRARFDAALLREAAQRLVDRHEILRTSFDLTTYGEAVQLVHPRVEVPLTLEDLRHLPPAGQEAYLADWLERSREAPIDVTAAPLFRFHVHRRAEDAFQLTLPHHHAILDGWSVSALFAGLLDDYLASLRGERRLAAPVEVSFRDYVALERSALASAEHRRHWAQKTAGAPACSVRGFPDRDAGDGPRYRAHHVDLGLELSEAITSLASSMAVSQKSVLLAAHVRVLGLCTGQSEVVTGVATDGRPERHGGDRVLGLFLNSAPFRVELQGGTWMDLVREVFSLERESSPFRHYPLARIESDNGGRPSFDTVFNYTHFHVLAPLEGLEGVQVLERYSFARSSFRLVANFDVAASADRRLTLHLAYDGAELADDQVIAMGDLYRGTLAAMTSVPLRSYESDVGLSAEERARLLAIGNDTHTDYPRETCLHRLFEVHARRAPDAPALRSGDERVGYGELDRRADRLARRLRKLGVGPDVRVGVCLDRSIELVVGILAVLKAGGAYVPMDPAYPEERLAFMLGDAGATAVLSQRRFAGRLAGGGRRVVILDEAPDDAEDDSAPLDDGGATADNLAYVMYTSGSTGKPKGVCIPHRGVARLVLGTDYVDLGPDEVVLQLASIAFDASTFEIWGALLRGGLLALPGPDKPSLADLAATIQRFGATTMVLTPALFHPLVEAHPDAFRGVRQLLVGGDVVSPAHALAVARSHPGCRVINGYGPTESTTFAVCHSLLRPEREIRSVPIGRAIANTRVYVCDGRLEPSPVGVPGELLIGGDGLARGYLNRPSFTAERFIPDPFSGQPGARLYRTGDRVRRLPDGDIEFLNRMDQQVKIRGIRVELGEIEATLRSHPSVSEAVAVLRDDATGPAGLIAYVVRLQGSELDRESGRYAGELRGFLARKLPEAMVPQAIVAIDALPITATGKLDRGALPAPPRVHPELRAGFEGPRTPFEEILAGIWSALLGIEHVGVHDDFFELGGNSLVATQVISRVRDRLQTELPLRAAFDAPTVAELAAAAEASRRAVRSRRRPPIAAMEREGRAALSTAQEQLFRLDRALRGLPFFNMPARLHLKGPLDAPALARSLDDVVARHEALRTTFDLAEGVPAQIIAPALSIELSLLDLRALSVADRSAESARLAHAEAREPFDLTRGPLLRASLLQLDDEEHVLLLTMHHIVGDGWSMGVMTREVTAAYESLVGEAPPPLPPLRVQYADFAAWQTGLLASGGFDGDLAYWRRELAPPLERLRLGRRSRPTEPSSLHTEASGLHTEPSSLHTTSVAVAISGSLVASLRTLAREQGASLFMVLLAALNVLLHRAAGQDDIRVGALVANRTCRETEDLIGLFLNTVVLRADLSGDPTFRDVLRAARDRTLAAYDHQDVPFEAVLRVLSADSGLDRASVFQAMLVLQNAPAPRLSVPGLTIERWRGSLPPPPAATAVDLTLVLEEAAGGLAGSLIYRADLFDEESIGELLSDFEGVLEAVASRADERLSALGAPASRGSGRGRPKQG